ncbi:MAG: hypothetical protein LBG65_02955 [Puniceicoccales bacterium]|jgi:O-succinylbenzoate synthase|nr:hypothetical protein [Puniceicoccales bacterium]
MEKPALVWRRVWRAFRVPLKTGAGVFHGRESILLRLAGRDGTPSGFGEIAPWAGFGCETLDAAEDWLRDVAQNAAPDGAPPVPPAGLPCTRAAFEMVREMASPAPGSSLPLRCAALLAPPAGPPGGADVAHLLDGARAAGFRTFKLKISADPDSFSLATRLLGNLRDGELLRLDANASLAPGLGDIPQALALWLPLLENPAIEFLEQPFSPARMEALGLGMFPARFHPKIALDESVGAGREFPSAWPGPLVVKPAMLPDWGSFRRWRMENPASVVVYSSVFETAIGREAALRLAGRDPAAAAGAHGFGTSSIFPPADPWGTPSSPDSVAARLNWSMEQWDSWFFRNAGN